MRPNNDTIYGAGYIDPSAEPILVRVPDAGKRFWSIQLADPWTNIAPGIGSRSGSKPGLYALVGPKWKGKLPDGATEVRLGEGHHQIVLRVGYSSFANQVDTDADLKKAVETLHGFVVTPLSKFSPKSIPDRAPNSEDAPQPPTSLRAITAGMAERRPLTLLALIRDAAKDPSAPLFTASDFGRTLTINGDGTDHGWGGHHFIVGGAVRGKQIYGAYPDLTFGNATDAGNGRLIPTTAVEQYAATLATWMGVPPPTCRSSCPICPTSRAATSAS